MFEVFRTKRRKADEPLGKYIAGIAERVVPMPNEWQLALNQLIRQKAYRVASDQEFFEVMLHNTQFFISMEQELEQLLGQYLTAKKFPSLAQVQVTMASIVSKHQSTKFVSRELRGGYDKYHSANEKADASIADFSFHRTYYSILGYMCNVVFSNPPVQDFLVQYEVTESLAEIKKYAVVHSNLLLDSFELKL